MGEDIRILRETSQVYGLSVMETRLLGVFKCVP